MVSGAGVLPVGYLGGACYFLLGQEGWFFNRRWTDLGGSLDKGEWALMGAAREAHEESRGALGSKTGLLLRLLWAKETINVHGYRSYSIRWWLSDLTEVPQRFKQSTLTQGHVYNEMNRLQWVSEAEVFGAAMRYRIGSGRAVTTATGKRLNPRLTAVIRRSFRYKKFAASHVVCMGTRYRGMSRSTTGGLWSGVTVVKLSTGRVFAILQRGNSVSDLRLENRTWMNIKDGPGWLASVRDMLLWVLLLRPYDVTVEEREAVFQALVAESWVHRIGRSVSWLTGSWSTKTI